MQCFSPLFLFVSGFCLSGFLSSFVVFPVGLCPGPQLITVISLSATILSCKNVEVEHVNYTGPIISLPASLSQFGFEPIASYYM